MRPDRFTPQARTSTKTTDHNRIEELKWSGHAGVSLSHSLAQVETTVAVFVLPRALYTGLRWSLSSSAPDLWTLPGLFFSVPSVRAQTGVAHRHAKIVSGTAVPRLSGLRKSQPRGSCRAIPLSRIQGPALQCFLKPFDLQRAPPLW